MTEPIGYVVANLDARRSPALSSASVLSLEDAAYEVRQWMRVGAQYTVCELHPVPLDVLSRVPEPSEEEQ